MTSKTALSAALLVLGAAVLPAAAQHHHHFHPPVLPPPSVTLADTNATPMETRELAVEAHVDGLYATVQTTLRFHNPNGRDLEGELVFPLPDGAAVCGYALDVDGELVDGVVVPKEKARVAFETETRRRVDPGLVEYVKGNVYKTRIYPLPRGASRTVKVTYTTPLATSPAGDAALALPMPRTPLAKRHVKIEVVRHGETAPALGGLGDSSFAPAEQLWRVGKTEEDVTPADDLLVDAEPARNDDEQPVRLKPRVRHRLTFRKLPLDAVEAIQERLYVVGRKPAEKIGAPCKVEYGGFYHISLFGT